MRAVVINEPGGFESIAVVDRDERAPTSGEVSVRWRATSLNYHDYLVGAGAIKVADGRVPMSDGAGEIIALGEGVANWQVGDKVMSSFFPRWTDGRASFANMSIVSGETVDGYLCEQSCVAANSLTKIPEGYSYAEAATLPCAALTAWRALIECGKLQAGQSVLVEGTGGMSIFALQLAKLAGAEVYATSSSDEKLARLTALGADHVINYKTEPKWGKAIAKLSAGGVDHVLDVGGSATIGQGIEAVGVGGHISLIGILGGRSAEMVLPKLFFKQVRMSGLAVGSVQMQNDMLRAINLSGMRPVIDRSFDLTQLGEAFAYQASGKHFGKIVLEY